MERDAYLHTVFAGPAYSNYARGTSSSHGTTQSRGTAYGNYRQYPKGLRVNAAGSALMVSPDGGTALFVFVAGETCLARWSAIAPTGALGTSSIDNYIIIWD